MWREVRECVLDLFFPPKCAFCQKILCRGQRGMCPQCAAKLPRLSKSDGVQRPKGAGTCYSPLHYEDMVRKSIHRYKFSGRPGYAQVYGTLMTAYIKDHCKELPQAVTWVPLSKKRLRNRGYDQAYLLAREVADGLKLPLVSTLKKVRHTTQQSTLPRDERSANVMGAYETVKGCNLTDKTFLLIDDVTTSGATLAECTYALRLAGADGVVCGTLARAF